MLEPAHLDRDFDYLVPAKLDALAQPGVRVRVRFSGRLVDGFILDRLDKTDHTGRLMKLERVVSGERVLTPEILRLVTAVAARYAGTRADVLRLAIPPRHAKVEGEKPKDSGESKDSGEAKGSVLPKNSGTADRGTVNGGVGAEAEVDAGRGPEAVADETNPSASGGESPSGRESTPTSSGAAGRAPTGDETEVTALGSDADEARNGEIETTVPAPESDQARGDESETTVAARETGRGGEIAGDGPTTGDVHASWTSGTETHDHRPTGEQSGAESGADREARCAVRGLDPSGLSDADVDANPAASVDLSHDSEWERYRHGRSFLGALAEGKGPRAAWQAVPGEDWARRLAELAAVVVRGGRGAVLIVPDQRDLDRLSAACAEVVGDSAVALAAGLGPAARYRRWLAALRGTARVVIGTRSAVFAPVQALGLVAIWDDGDDTYGEPRSPYPHAREVAMLRAYETGAAFVAGGFARTAEIQAVVESGWAHDLVADRAVVRQFAPRISAPGDSDIALERDPVARAVRIPAVAFTAARKALAAGEPVLVQVPRRGYVPALACAKCRTPARCRHCNGPLTLPDESAASGSTGAQRNRGRRNGKDMSTAPEGARKENGAANPADAGGRYRGEQRPSSRELGVAVSRGSSGEVAHSPSCRWCGRMEPVFRCASCGSRALRAVVIGAARTAEELGRAFPGVPIRGSGGAAVLDSVSDEPQVVVATIGAEPPVPGGYGVALLLDGWALLGRADLRAAEDALRRWMCAAALVRSSGQVIVMAEPSVPTVQALVRWDPVGHAVFELEERSEVRFPPAVRFAAIDGTTDSIAELLGEAKLPEGIEVLGPVPLPPGARKPFSSGDSPVEVERMILRADRRQGSILSRALTAAQAVYSTHRSTAPLRVQIDPIDIG
ncbi:primosomal protein N' [Nocardia sp. BMG51109]|uniref:primosomal protein N' n=1 Tax=Nocardia sp. BMG51109 TaxID=1056816 RepID=UPI001E529E67|nr:primosomal protein N' [Nocardia sp. BMG51109]